MIDLYVNCPEYDPEVEVDNLNLLDVFYFFESDYRDNFLKIEDLFHSLDSNHWYEAYAEISDPTFVRIAVFRYEGRRPISTGISSFL